MERCNPNQDCPLWPTCVEDDHHLYHPEKLVRRRFGVKFFLAHVLRDVCRAEHEQYHIENPTNLPTREQVQEWELQQQQLKNLRANGPLTN